MGSRVQDSRLVWVKGRASKWTYSQMWERTDLSGGTDQLGHSYSTIRHSHYLLRAVYPRKVHVEEVQLGIHHHRRSASNQECRFFVVTDYPNVYIPRKASHHRYTAAEQFARAVVVAQLYPARRVLIQVSYGIRHPVIAADK